MDKNLIELKPKNPDLLKPIFIDIESIIPGIKPPFPLTSRAEYDLYFPDNPLYPLGTAEDISGGLNRPELQNFFKPFEGQIVVEIGSGPYISGYKVALFCKARAYVGVEPYEFVKNLKKGLKKAEEVLGSSSPQIPRTAVQADALSFLKRLPGKSVSVFASQLESIMKEKYEIAVAKEIQRVLHPEGAFIQYDSTFSLDGGLFKSDLFDRDGIGDFIIHHELKKYQRRT